MADNRRILNSLHIIPKESATLEEGHIKWTLLQTDARGTALGKKLGGKSINVAVAKNPWGDGWFSGIPDEVTWDTMDETWNVTGDVWSNTLNIDETPGQIAQGTLPPSTKIACCYIKNLTSEVDGSAIDVAISLNGGTSYPLIIKPGGGIFFNNVSGSMYLDRIWAKTAAGTQAEIEYIIIN